MLVRIITLGALIVALVAHGAPAGAQTMCPPPPNPNSGNCSPLEFDRSVLVELDGDLDGSPDNFGSTGTFCTGGAPVDCSPSPDGQEVAFDLYITNPALQDVTCTVQIAEIWITNGTCSTCMSTGTGSVTLSAGSSVTNWVKVVVADTNSDICVCDGLVTCTFSREAECSDGADGDGDGLIDAADPDCCLDNDGDGFCGAADCDDTNPLVHGPSRPIDDLALGARGGAAELAWDVPAGEWVDVAAATRSDVLSSGDLLSSVCLIEDDATGAAVDSRPDPPPGDAYFYLARSQNTCAGGSYANLGPFSQQRSDLDTLEPCAYDPACPGCVSCDLQDPAPECGAEQCVATGTIPGSTCDGPTGPGGEGAACASPNDCGAGLTCYDGGGGIGGGLQCGRWCRAGIDCPGAGQWCSFPSPAPVVNGTSYGICTGF